MQNQEREDTLQLAIDTYGSEAQALMMIEEMSELTKALSKLRRAHTPQEIKEASMNVLEEIADVQIMLDQMRLIFGNTSNIEDSKLKRLENRLARQ